MKKGLTLITAAAMAVSMSITAFAGGWQQDSIGWWWQNDDGTWPANTWVWLDGDGDGALQCYYFDGNGYMLSNAVTSDGYTVNADGAWIENGIVKSALSGTWQGYHIIPGLTITYTFYADGTMYYDIVDHYYGYDRNGNATYSFDGQNILIDTDEYYIDYSGALKLVGNQIIATDSGEEGFYPVYFDKQ